MRIRRTEAVGLSDMSNADGTLFCDIDILEEGDTHYNPETEGKQIRFENCVPRGTELSN